MHHPEDNIITDSREYRLLEWQARSLHVSKEERDANARLIAKAPDLLASLQEMYNEYCSAMRSEFDFPGRPWTPERDNDEPAMRARALLVQLGGTP